MLRTAFDALPRALSCLPGRAVAVGASEISQCIADQLRCVVGNEEASTGRQTRSVLPPNTSRQGLRCEFQGRCLSSAAANPPGASSAPAEAAQSPPMDAFPPPPHTIKTLEYTFPMHTSNPPTTANTTTAAATSSLEFTAPTDHTTSPPIATAMPTTPPTPPSPPPTPTPVATITHTYSPYLDDTMSTILSWPSLQHVTHFFSNPALTLHPAHITAALRRVQQLSKSIPPEDLDLRSSVSSLLAHLVATLPKYPPSDLAQSLFHLGQLREVVPVEAAAQIIAALEGKLGTLPTAKAVVEVMWALRHLGMMEPALMAEARFSALERLPQLDAKGVSMLVSTLAAAGIYDWSSFNLITRAIIARLPDFSHPQLCAVASAFARVGHPDEGFFECLAEQASRRIDSCRPTHITQLCAAFARMRHRNVRFCSVAAARAQKVMHLFTAKQVSSLAHAYAVQRIYDPPFYDNLCARALQVLPEAAPRDLSTLLWALGRQGHRHELLMSAVAQEVIAKLPQLENLHLATVVASYGRFQMYSELLFAAVAAEAAGRMEGEIQAAAEAAITTALSAPPTAPFPPAASPAFPIDPDHAGGHWQHGAAFDEGEGAHPSPSSAPGAFQGHHLGEIARAYALVGHTDQRLMGALASLVAPLLPQCTTRTLADLAWGYAQLSLLSPELMDAIAVEAARRLPSFPPEQLGDLLWAFAILQHQSAPLQEAAVQVVMEVVAPMKEAALLSGGLQDLARLVWCFNALGWEHPGLMAAWKEVEPSTSDAPHATNPMDAPHPTDPTDPAVASGASGYAGAAGLSAGVGVGVEPLGVGVGDRNLGGA